MKSNFLATVSHELRTPLTSVIGFADMLLKEIAGPLNEEQRDYTATDLPSAGRTSTPSSARSLTSPVSRWVNSRWI